MAERDEPLTTDLGRLRALSSLALLALEREDLRRLQEVVSEGDEIVRRLGAKGGEDLPADIRTAIENVIETNRRVVQELEVKRLDVAHDLAELRRTRSRVAAARNSATRVPRMGLLDRTT